MKFVISYSGGKDSVLSLHKMLEAGNDPIGLLVMINRNMQRSWFHGVDIHMLKQISSSIEIPLIMCESAGEDYHTALEDGLKRASKRVLKPVHSEISTLKDIENGAFNGARLLD